MLHRFQCFVYSRFDWSMAVSQSIGEQLSSDIHMDPSVFVITSSLRISMIIELKTSGHKCRWSRHEFIVQSSRQVSAKARQMCEKSTPSTAGFSNDVRVAVGHGTIPAPRVSTRNGSREPSFERRSIGWEQSVFIGCVHNHKRKLYLARKLSCGKRERKRRLGLEK